MGFETRVLTAAQWYESLQGIAHAFSKGGTRWQETIAL